MPEYSIKDVDNAIYGGKFLVWIDDRSKLPTTKEYLAKNTKYVADSMKQGFEFCKTMCAIERIVYGKVETVFHVSGQGMDNVYLEDIDQETANALIARLCGPPDAPLPPAIE